MANVLNRTTGLTVPYRKDYRQSVNTPDFGVADWIIQPDLSAVEGFSNIYWDITGDVVSLAGLIERNTRDSELAALQLQADKDEAKTQTDADRRLLGFMQVMVDEINILRSNASIPPARTLQDYKTATKNNIDGQS